jgi:undecaprenyl diphosphate synthase
VTEDEFSNALWTSGMPDPDIIVRTSGEQRLSGFLPWQGVYSELFFIETHWPAFSKEDFQKIIAEYHERDRRHGK